MFGFLGFLLILFLLIVFIGFSILGNIFRVLFGFGRRNTHYQDRTYTDSRQNTYRQHQSDEEEESYTEASSSSSGKRGRSSGNKKKIFDDDEGEYVDYEEVK